MTSSPARRARRGFSVSAAIAVAFTAAALAGFLVGPAGPADATAPRVLRVGSWHGQAGTYPTIQSAVDTAHPGDWVLVGPGDYHERADYTSHKAKGTESGGGVWITTPGVHLRGMSRNAVIVDGTRPGARQCSSTPADQLFGPPDSSGHPLGRNGVEVYKADRVTVDNLTVCNYLAGSSSSGNEIWWDGGESGAIGGWGFSGSYLTATSTFYSTEATAAKYGIFSSNWSGGTWDQTYASNFNDSGYYIGACQQVCNQVVNHAWSQFNALGYSGSNSGGSLVIENSQFDHNEDGFDTNSQNGDNPPPQDGSCPGGGTSPITHTTSCWVFMHNYVHDNNNPNVPSSGSAAAGPVGTGLSLSGGRNDTVMANRFENNGAWGVIFVPYPDNGPPCTGGTMTPAACLYDDSGNALLGNTFSGNGFFGNPTNGDFAEANLEPGPSNCFRGNTTAGGGSPTSSPPTLQTTSATCGGTVPPDLNPAFVSQVACDSESITIGPVPGSSLCTPGANYPRRSAVVMHPVPAGLASMPNPCAGVPANPWCASTTRGSGQAGQPASPGAASGPFPASGALPATGFTTRTAATALLLLMGAGTVRWARRRAV